MSVGQFLELLHFDEAIAPSTLHREDRAFCALYLTALNRFTILSGSWKRHVKELDCFS